MVGTLLALLVFFALFGIFLTQYLPLWMTDNEVQFTSQTQASMATFKSNVDYQLSSGAPPVFATPFVMSSQGVPLLAQPTGGTLMFLPQLPGVFASVKIDVGPGGGAPYTQNITNLGTLTMTLPNRYFSPQIYQFQDDAVLQSQGGTNQLVNFPPILIAQSVPGNSSATLALVNLYGNSTTTISTGTQDVYSKFLFVQSIISNGKHVGGVNLPFNVTFKIGSQFPCAWEKYLGGLLPSTGVGYTITPAGACTQQNGVPQIVTLVLKNLNYFTLYFAGFQVTLGVGVG